MVSPLSDDGARRAPRVSLLGAFLVLTLVLASWLGYEAVTAAGSHRQTAESVLRDYAEISLGSFVGAAEHNLDDALDRIFDDVDGDLRYGRRGLPDPNEILWELDDGARAAGCRECQALQSPLLAFTADLTTGAVRVVPDTVPPARVRDVVEAVVAARPDVSRYDEGFLTVPAGGLFPDPVTVGYGLAKDSLGGTRVMAFVGPEATLEELFATWFRDQQLLPDPIGGELANDSLLHVTVTATDGRVVFRSPVEYPTTLGASDVLPARFGGMDVEVAVRPDQASQLIIGGLPSSRLPLLATLLVLALGLGGAALVQLRREARFQRLRDDFVSGVSHELRTPLAQIRMFAELQDLGKLSSPEDRRRANAVIHREARRLSHLVENILQFSRLRHREGPAMPKEDLDLADALGEGVDAMRSLLHDRSMSLTVRSEPGLRVRANRDSLTRIVVNLLDNAAKYGPEGQEVMVDVERVDGTARIAVADRGPGVPPADRRRIWRPYRRLERHVKARLPGTGIGLSVVAELARTHGGRAWVEDAEGGGARFVVELPLAGTGEARRPAGAVRAPVAAG